MSMVRQGASEEEIANELLNMGVTPEVARQALGIANQQQPQYGYGGKKKKSRGRGGGEEDINDINDMIDEQIKPFIEALCITIETIEANSNNTDDELELAIRTNLSKYYNNPNSNKLFAFHTQFEWDYADEHDVDHRPFELDMSKIKTDDTMRNNIIKYLQYVLELLQQYSVQSTALPSMGNIEYPVNQQPKWWEIRKKIQARNQAKEQEKDRNNKLGEGTVYQRRADVIGVPGKENELWGGKKRTTKKRGGKELLLSEEIVKVSNLSNLRQTPDPYQQAADAGRYQDIPQPFSAGMTSFGVVENNQILSRLNPNLTTGGAKKRSKATKKK